MSQKGGRSPSKAIALIVLTFLVALVFVNGATAATAWSLAPPFLAILVSLLSGRLILSLGSAVVLGSFLSRYGESGSLFQGGAGAVSTTVEHFAGALSEPTNLQILGFVFLVLSMVHIISLAGGLHALVLSLQKWIVGPRSAQFVTALLGCLIFIDDYANTMIVGSTMKNVTDRYGVSREKLAFIVDATSAPIAGVALVSTWVGYEVGLFSEMAQQFSWPIDGYGVFLDAIQFRFYCFFMLIFVFFNIAFGFDFGPMAKAKLKVVDLEQKGITTMASHPLMALLPLATLLTLVLTLLWADGGGFSGVSSIFSFTDWRQVLMRSENGVSILLVSALVSYLVTLFMAFFWIRVTLPQLGRAFVMGVKASWIPLVVLVLAWSVKLVCDDLQTGQFLVSQLGQRVALQWLPLAVFLMSAVTAFATGTSWGTMAILIPTVTPLAVEISGGSYGIYISLCLASILDGAIMGDHCSPISDTTIMSSISSECDLLSHVRTQLPYTLIVGFLAVTLGYLPASFHYPVSLSFTIYIAFLFLFFWSFKKIARRVEESR